MHVAGQRKTQKLQRFLQILTVNAQNLAWKTEVPVCFPDTGTIPAESQKEPRRTKFWAMFG
jgi:hypothetical protein